MVNEGFRTGIFVSYSHADSDWLKRLRTHMTPYLRGEKLELWDDNRISAGADWAADIERELARARVAVLLVTPDFLASDFVAQVELPALLKRRNDLTVLWIPIRASAYDVTPLKHIQAAHSPNDPLAALPAAKQDEALVAIARRIATAADINAAGNAFRIIDSFDPEMSAFLQGRPEPEQTPEQSVRAKQVDETIQVVGPVDTLIITAADFEKLGSDAQKLIRAYERTMKELFERWTELKPKRIAHDPETRRDAREQSEEIRRELCGELTGLLGFFESMGMSLQDHYAHARYICGQY
jgi:hypothetical protein